MNELAGVPRKDLILGSDFRAYSKIRIDNHGYNEYVPVLASAACLCLIILVFRSSYLPSKFKVKQYCPIIFRDLRERFGIEPEEYPVRPVVGCKCVSFVCASH